MLMAGAISLGVMLGVLLAQRTSLRGRTLGSLVLALAAVCGCAALVAGTAAAMTVAIVAPLGYAMRRILDGH
jgi:hypothetical protein